MNTTWKSPQRIASVLLLSVVLAGCASGPNAPPPALQQQIETARTRSDHETLASYYQREAAASRAVAAEHRKMAKSYVGATGRGGPSMQGHCNAIVSSSESIAAEYEGLAADHRRLAAQAQP